jgi:predicted dienelactone hydrolase
MSAGSYDPFVTGAYAVVETAFELPDSRRGWTYPCVLWRPGRGDARLPLVVYSHPGGGSARSAATLCAHLASHGYAVAAMTHAERVAAELAPRDGETDGEHAARVDAIVGARVPGLRLLLDALLARDDAPGRPAIDPARVGLIGHSFGGWTVLATPDVDERIRSVVALAPGGAANPRPGVLALTLAFGWRRPVPALYLAGDADVLTPLDGIEELYGRAPEPKRLVVLRGADHEHFMDDAEREHEALRAATLPGDGAWIPSAMRPFTELVDAGAAQAFVCGLASAHFDATLRGLDGARRYLAGDVVADLAARGIPAYTP